MFLGYLKQSTASQTRVIGPFVDETDGFTAETGLTIANTDIKVSKNGAAQANKNSGGGTHLGLGEYAVTWDATDTATVGELRFTVKVAAARVIYGSYAVVEESVYDRMFAASAIGPMIAAEVNAEVVDALATDTYAEPGQGSPSATLALSAKINYLFKWARNKKVQEDDTVKYYDSAGTTVDQKSSVTKSGGVVTVGTKVTGP